MATTAFDPTTTAQSLADIYVSSRQTRVDTQTKSTKARLTALNDLQTALQAFNTSMTTLSGKKTLLSKQATTSSDAVTVSAAATAIAGTYSLFVEKVATNHQMSYNFPASLAAAGAGTLGLSLADGTSISVNLASSDADGNGSLSAAEVARAINTNGSNNGKLSAMVMTVGGTSKLVLSSTATGASGAITVNATGVNDATFKSSLGAGTQVSAAQDAVVWLGNKDTGVRFQQASNSFSAIDGVTVQLQKAMSATDAPISVTVSDDSAGTKENVNSFATAFNALITKLDTLTRAADENNSVTAGAFSTDAGIRSLRSQVNSILRQKFDGLDLTQIGIKTDKTGKISVDDARLQKFLASNAQGLDKFFGQNTLTSKTGVFGAMGTYVDTWVKTTGGQISQRKDSLSQIQKSLDREQTRIDSQFDKMYSIYLKQFTALQSLQSQMEQTTATLDSLPTFSTSKN